MIEIMISGEKKPRSINEIEGFTYGDVARACGLNQQAILVFVNGKPQPNDKLVTDGEKINVLKVFSGG